MLRERVIELFEADTEQSFVEAKSLLFGKGADPEAKSVSFTGDFPLVSMVKAVERSGVRSRRPYEENAAPPFDLRSRMFVQALLQALGKRRHEPARATLVELLTHPTFEIQLASTHALAAFADAPAAETLAAKLEVLRGSARGVAIRALFEIERARAYERLESHLGTEGFARDVLYVLFRDCAWNNELRRMVPQQGWVNDARLVALAEKTLAETKDKDLRDMVRDLLAAADPALRAKPVKKPAPKKTSKAKREAMLQRAREQLEPFRKEIAAVVQRGRAAGLRFLATEPIVPPAADVERRLAGLEKKTGPLPATVRAFLERFGAVDLRTELPPERQAEADALVVLSLSAIEAAFEDHESEEAFCAPLVPEPLAKAGYSAGPAYAVRCGEPMQDDPVLEGDPARRTFLEHVRYALQRSVAARDDHR